MTKLKLITISLAISLAWFINAGQAAAPPATSTTTSTITIATTTTTTTTIAAQKHPECAEWLNLAIGLGWERGNLPMLERVMWKESRCQPHQFNAADPNGGSLGLTQVNKFWCLPSRWYPSGYLQTHGVLNTCDDLFNPAINLSAALAIYDYAKGWSQWGL
jgi:hypothetical protein